jgi:CelD/BcsL family acetyltransferase involved in cellulose biosynthesis
MQQHSSNTNNSNGRSAAAAAAVAAAAAGSPKLQAAWEQLQQERPDVFYCVDERHVDFISKQSKEEQLKVRCCLRLVQSF